MAVDDGISVGEKLGGRACVVEGADNLFRVQALSLRNALLLKNGGEHHSIGEAEAPNEIGRENLTAQSVGARLEHRPKAT